MNIKTISVLGLGLMGTQIAVACAKSGYETVCYDIDENKVEQAKAFLHSWLNKQLKKDRMTIDEADFTKNNMKFVNSEKAAVESAELVIEAITENEEMKCELFKRIDRWTKDDCIYASNSSYIVSSKFSECIEHSENLLNLHFFNPALVMKVVEVVRGAHTSNEIVDIVIDFAKSIDKEPVLVNKEIYGFIVNRVFSALTREACYLVDMGIASIEDIDKAIKGGLGHPMGPLELLDLTGIDLEYNVYSEKFKNTGEKADLPASCIVERYARGEFGRKSGKGFYSYE